MKFFTVFGLCFFFCLFSPPALYPQAAYSQPFSSIDSDLQQLENLINDTLRDMEEQQKLLEDLQRNRVEVSAGDAVGIHADPAELIVTVNRIGSQP